MEVITILPIVIPPIVLIVGVDGVDLLEELGVPEAMWHLRVNGFATICTMDSHGNSLHREIEQASLGELGKFAEPVFTESAG